MTDQSEIDKMKSDANRELNGIKFKKSKVTRNINQCLILLEVCKGEAQILNSSLLHMGERAMTRDELDTLLKEACAIINNTPMYEPSDNSDDALPISPAHLLLLKSEPNPSPPESFSKADLNAYGKLRWRKIQYIADQFWDKWHKFYLHSLQSRSKWTKDGKNVRCGDFVLIVDKQLRRNMWKSGVIQSVIASNDGVVRSCMVKTKSGIFRRAVKDLVLLVS